MILPTRIELSSRMHIPVIRVYQRTFYPHQFLQRMFVLHRWRLLQRNPPIVNADGQIIITTPTHFDIMFGEWLSWTRDYLPSFCLNGLNILDVGAGCGETAFFFLLNGAEKVICVEPNEQKVELLKKNASRNGWNVDIVNGFFQLEMLRWKIDYMKMDCEGCERKLLELDSLPPSSIEVHDTETHRRLVEKFDAKTLSHEKGNWIVQVPDHSRP